MLSLWNCIAGDRWGRIGEEVSATAGTSSCALTLTLAALRLLVCRLDSCHLLPVEVKQLSGGREGEGARDTMEGDGRGCGQKKSAKTTFPWISTFQQAFVFGSQVDSSSGVRPLRPARCTLPHLALFYSSPRDASLHQSVRQCVSAVSQSESVSAPADRPFINPSNIKHQTNINF